MGIDFVEIEDGVLLSFFAVIILAEKPNYLTPDVKGKFAIIYT